MSNTEKRTCPWCKEGKDIFEFRKLGQNYSYLCKKCEKIVLEENEKLLQQGKKRCFKCGEIKDTDEFPWRDKKRGIRRNECKLCRKRYHSDHYEKNKDEISIKSHQRYEKRKEQPVEGEGTSFCWWCEEEKPWSKFNRQKHNPDECYKVCRKCEKEIRSLNETLFEEGEKICWECLSLLEIEEFGVNKGTNDGLSGRCKECNNEHGKEYYSENPEKVCEYQKGYNREHPEVKKVWIENNRDHLRAYWRCSSRERREITENRICDNIRTRLRLAIKNKQKVGSAVRDLSCEVEQLVLWLEAQFYNNPKTGEMMSWENYGKGGWEIDHVVPLRFFDLENREEFLKANHFNNLQPLWQRDHVDKGKYEHIFAQHI